MFNDILQATHSNEYQQVLEAFLKSKKIVILCAEDSALSIRMFQQQLITIGKFIRIVTSAHHNLSLLDNLQKDDLLMVCSVTGNFVLAINNQIKQIKAFKCLITLNTNALLKLNYEVICYLGVTGQFSSQQFTINKNVYTQFGLTYFFDLLFHDFFVDTHGQ